MLYKFDYSTEEEYKSLIDNNKELHLIKKFYSESEKYLIFTDEEVIDEPLLDEIVKEQGNKISILEAENQALREELTQIQTSIDSLTSLITATLEEK